MENYLETCMFCLKFESTKHARFYVLSPFSASLPPSPHCIIVVKGLLSLPRSYSSGGEDGYVRVHKFDPSYFKFDFEY